MGRKPDLSKLKMKKSTLKKYKQKRGETDMNLVTMVTMELNGITTDRTGDVFNNTKEMQRIINLKPATQRVVINRYFLYLLLRLRGKKNIPVSNVIMYLTLDGGEESWFKYLRGMVLPFIVKHKLIKGSTDERGMSLPFIVKHKIIKGSTDENGSESN